MEHTTMEILRTTNYDQFKFLEENRKIVPNHQQNIQKSIVQEDLLHINPILVDEDMNIIDGQHRLLSAKKLKRPIYYSVVSGIDVHKSLHLLQNSRKWELPDYINFYEKTAPEKGYRIFKEFSELYSISNACVAKLFALFNKNQDQNYSRVTVARMKQGDLKMENVDLEGMHDALEKYDLFRSFCIDRMIRPKTIYSVERATYAFCIFYSFYKPDWNVFMEQLEDRWFTLKPGRGYRDIVKDLVLIYNFKRTKKLLIYERFEKLARTEPFFVAKGDILKAKKAATEKEKNEKNQIRLHNFS